MAAQAWMEEGLTNLPEKHCHILISGRFFGFSDMRMICPPQARKHTERFSNGSSCRETWQISHSPQKHCNMLASSLASAHILWLDQNFLTKFKDKEIYE